MSSRDRRILLTLAGACAVLSAAAALVGLADVIAFAGPLIAVLVPLVLGRYPGERAFVSRVARVRRLRPRRRFAPRGPVLVLVPRGTTLMACSLAVRPPPLVTP